VIPLAASDRWHDWRWQLANMLDSADELARYVELDTQEHAGLARSAALFRVGVTPYYASLMDRHDPTCPIRMQVIPHPREADVRDEELRDPLGEDSHRPAPAVVHK
jgi:lysine 2,3-aminomutase